MRRRRSTRSVIKLLAAAAVATASIVGLVRLSTPRRLPTLADRLKVRFARFAPMADAGADQPTLPKGLGTVEMRLDPRNPPDPESTILHLLVRQNGCHTATGPSGVERMPKPEVIESATEIRVAMGVLKLPGAYDPPHRVRT